MTEKSISTLKKFFACFLAFLTVFICVNPIEIHAQNYISYEKSRRKFVVYTTNVDFEDAYFFICKRDNVNGRVVDVVTETISSVDGAYASEIQEIAVGYDYHIMIFNKEFQPLFSKLVLNYDTPNGTGNSGFSEDFTPYY